MSALWGKRTWAGWLAMSANDSRLNQSTQHFTLDGKIECMQYFPKRTDLSVYSQAHLNKVARRLNERPRKTLEFEIPAERFNASVASTS